MTSEKCESDISRPAWTRVRSILLPRDSLGQCRRSSVEHRVELHRRYSNATEKWKHFEGDGKCDVENIERKVILKKSLDLVAKVTSNAIAEGIFGESQSSSCIITVVKKWNFDPLTWLQDMTTQTEQCQQCVPFGCNDEVIKNYSVSFMKSSFPILDIIIIFGWKTYIRLSVINNVTGKAG